jgi:hypothetical protein
MFEQAAVMPRPNGHRAERDGCACPPWVRCIHFDGVILGLSERDKISLPGCSDCGGGKERTNVAFGVHTFREPVQHCPCGYPGWLSSQVVTPSMSFPDLPAAEAEFRRREAAMLRREVSP